MSPIEIYSTVANKIRNQVHSTSRGLKSTATKAIVVKGVEMAFQSGQQSYQVLKGVDWEIPNSDIQLLMGPSGSGKTTLLSILAGLLTPTA